MTSKYLDYSKFLCQIPQFIPFDYALYIPEYKQTLFQRLSFLKLGSIDFLQCKLPQFTMKDLENTNFTISEIRKKSTKLQHDETNLKFVLLYESPIKIIMQTCLMTHGNMKDENEMS